MKDAKRDDSFEATATAEERALARALDARGVPPVPRGTVMAIHLRARAEEASRRRAWRGAWAAAAAVAVLLGAWGTLRRGGAGGDPAADAFAAAEADWLSPWAEDFEELETTLLAFESMEMDLDPEGTAFTSL